MNQLDLNLLRQEHPRLLVSAQQFAEIKQQAKRSKHLGQWLKVIEQRAFQILNESPLEYHIPDGKWLLGVCRGVLERVFVLAFMHWMDGTSCWSQRAWKELGNAATFKDWNPSHFLDTAEMTCAFAIGYDWLYHALNKEQRAVIRAAIMSKGIERGLRCYRGEESYGWWKDVDYNWNQVCNGGMAIGALALADEEPEKTKEILLSAIASFRLPMARFAPDGGWPEGPMYWRYATYYTVLFFSCLQSALGSDFGFAKTPGFDKTGFFAIYMTGPFGEIFNFGDAHPKLRSAPQMFWFGKSFDQPVFSWYAYTFAEPHPLDFVWYHDRIKNPIECGLPLAAYFRDVEVASMRSAWEDSNAWFVTIKAGTPNESHSNLDLGSFVLDAMGERWALELGSDNYNLPGYFGAQRWNYYRMRAEGHNTLLINPGQGPDQNPYAYAKITRFETKPDYRFAVADLSQAYAANADQVLRGVKLLNGNGVLIQDQVDTLVPMELYWQFHTQAQIELQNHDRTALLQKGEKQMRVEIVQPKGCAFVVVPARPLPSSPNPKGQNQNENTQKLVIHLSSVKTTTVEVRFLPATAPLRLDTESVLIPLEQW